MTYERVYMVTEDTVVTLGRRRNGDILLQCATLDVTSGDVEIENVYSGHFFSNKLTEETD